MRVSLYQAHYPAAIDLSSVICIQLHHRTLKSDKDSPPSTSKDTPQGRWKVEKDGQAKKEEENRARRKFT